MLVKEARTSVVEYFGKNTCTWGCLTVRGSLYGIALEYPPEEFEQLFEEADNCRFLVDVNRVLRKVARPTKGRCSAAKRSGHTPLRQFLAELLVNRRLPAIIYENETLSHIYLENQSQRPITQCRCVPKH